MVVVVWWMVRFLCQVFKWKLILGTNWEYKRGGGYEKDEDGGDGDDDGDGDGDGDGDSEWQPSTTSDLVLTPTYIQVVVPVNQALMMISFTS